MEKRITKCVKALKTHNLDAILVSNPTNITYLSGFRNAEGYLLITRNCELFYFTNFIYEYEARQVKIWKVIVTKGNMFKLVAETLKRAGLYNVGFEAKNLLCLEYEKIKQHLCATGVTLLQTINFIEDLRAIKDAKEIFFIRKATQISEEAFGFIKEIYDSSMTEKNLSVEIEKFLLLKGSNDIAFKPIVAYGPNSAMPHHAAQEAGNNKHNFFLIDLGAKHCEYCADLTRMFTWGKISPFFKKVYYIVKKAQELAIAAIKDGVRASEVDRVAREFIEKKGYGKFFGHGLGHGVGLLVHESPFLSPRSEELLKEGMVVTVEPAIYIEGKFGIRIEDMVLVKKNRGEILSGHFYR